MGYGQAQFYSEETHRGLMPNPNLDDDEIRQVIAFLEWVGNVDNQGWPPRPIVVSSGQMAGATVGTDVGMAGVASDNPVAVGEAFFRGAALACAACHATQPGVTLAGPSLREQPAPHRRLLVRSDGKPNDVDRCVGRFGVEDARQAVAEARLYGVVPFCLTVDCQAPAYAARLFGPCGFAVLPHAERLPLVLVDVLRNLVA